MVPSASTRFLGVPVHAFLHFHCIAPSSENESCHAPRDVIFCIYDCAMNQTLKGIDDVLNVIYDDDEVISEALEINKFSQLLAFSVDCGWILSATFMVLTMQSGFALRKFYTNFNHTKY